MWKKILIGLCLLFVFLNLLACNLKGEENQADFSVDFKGMSQEKVHKILGEPSSALHGERGDVYILENKSKITIYYAKSGLVKNLLITDKDDIKTFTAK